LIFKGSFISQRLSASPIEYEDWPDLFKAVTSQQFPSELGLSCIKTVQQAQSWPCARVADWEENRCFVWSIRWHGTPEVIGQLSLLPRENELALAYWVNPIYWGQGITTEMCLALIQELVDTGFNGTLWAGSHTWNDRSSAVLNRLGFKFQAEVEHAYQGRADKIREYTLALGKG